MNIVNCYNDIISGKSNGVLPSVMRGSLSALSQIYGKIINRKNDRFDLGEGIFRALVPTISVGNITAGGTGKTPLVNFLCEYLLKKNIFPTVLMRGYKAQDNSRSLVVSSGRQIFLNAKASGDEASLIARSNPRAGLIIGKKRVVSAQLAVKDLQTQVLILDDGFQHRQLARDLDIVLIDATNPFGYERLLPRGLLREPLINLKRADIIIITKSNQVEDIEISNIKQHLRKFNSQAPILLSVHRPNLPISLNDWQQQNNTKETLPSGSKVALLSAIGNPQSFYNTAREFNYEIVHESIFVDHHDYKVSDIQRAAIEAQQAKAEAIITTEKDAVKISELSVDILIPIFVMPIKIDFIEGQEVLEKLVDVCLKKEF